MLLIVISYLIYGFVFIIPLLHFKLKTTMIFCALLYVTSHAMFWIGTAIMGRNILNSPILTNLLKCLKTLKPNKFKGNKEYD